jgi:Na+-transporting methylmalonyl-CoA/oxaloacetate decarboxylase gamma subunit
MTDQNKDYLSNTNVNAAQLPNATATLVLGILSIVICFICGIVALIISNKDVAMYKANPELYSAASYNNIKAGRICAVIGICVQVLIIIGYILLIAFFVSQAGRFKSY